MSASDARGAAALDTILGAALALFAVAAALALANGTVRLGALASAAAETSVAGDRALARIAREVERAGLGVCPGGEPLCPDEAIELLEDDALGVRGDLDLDDVARSRRPESDLAGTFARVRTGNDEVTVYLLRGPGATRTTFEADLDGPDRVTLADGTVVARRDGVVGAIDAGPRDAAVGAGGTLYRVTFTDDVRHAGSGRFRVVEPLADGVTALRVTAYDAGGAVVAACGGLDGAAARAARAQVRRVGLALELVDERGRALRLARDIALPHAGARP